MSKCKKCCKEFKYQWCLDRHLRRKIPCKKNNELFSLINEHNSVTNENDSLINEKNKVTNENDSLVNENDSLVNENDSFKFKCNYCEKINSTKSNLNQHVKTCKEKEDVVRSLEIQLSISYKKPDHNFCRFCTKSFSQSCNYTRHLKTCKAKDEYRKKLEAQLQEKTKQQSSITNNNITNNNNQTINVLNISAETLRKFGEENTDHITNSYLRHMMGRLGVTIPKVVSNVAKKIYCDDSKPENKTIQISNVRSQWAKVSNGNDYELQALGDSIKGVRNKVTDLYVTRLCDDFEFFKKVTARIDKLDDLNNQNYTARTLEDKEDQKNASKLKGDIDREIKSTIYNVQKSENKSIKAK